MLHHVAPKVSHLANAFVSMVEIRLAVEYPERVTLARHVTAEGHPLLEFRVMDVTAPRETNDYGTRQAWVLVYPETNEFKVIFTTRGELLSLGEKHGVGPSHILPYLALRAEMLPMHDLKMIVVLTEAVSIYLSQGARVNPDPF